jgi:hypothetical protein
MAIKNGWQGNVFWCEGKAFGVKLIPGRNYDWDVYPTIDPAQVPDEEEKEEEKTASKKRIRRG